MLLAWKIGADIGRKIEVIQMVDTKIEQEQMDARLKNLKINMRQIIEILVVWVTID